MSRTLTVPGRSARWPRLGWPEHAVDQLFAIFDRLVNTWPPSVWWRSAQRALIVRIGQNAGYYEDFQVGNAWESPRRTITETDIAMFAAFSGDGNPVHTDQEFAKSTFIGGTVLHESAGFAIATGLESRLGLREGTGIAFLGMTWDFKAPIRIADTLFVRERVVSKRETRKSETGIVTFHMQLANQLNQVVQEGEWKIMMIRRT